MSERDWKLFAEDIFEALELIESCVSGKSFQDFEKDKILTSAVIHNFEIIGEAVKHLPDELKRGHPEVDWEGITGLRNRIVHEYFRISAAIIWKIIEEELQPLKDLTKEILK